MSEVPHTGLGGEPPPSAGDVRFELPDHQPTRLPAREAAEVMVEAYGERTREREIAGTREATDAYWQEVERLLSISCADDEFVPATEMEA